MDPAAAEHLIHAYVQGWRTGDRAKILGTLAPDCVVVESHGPTYTGVDTIARWIDTWLGAGNTVDRWAVTSLEVTATGTACFFEWEFQCTFAGTRFGFAGASIARFSNNRIVTLREYKMTAAPSNGNRSRRPNSTTHAHVRRTRLVALRNGRPQGRPIGPDRDPSRPRARWRRWPARMFARIGPILALGRLIGR